jgi:hypothetical protein
MTHLDHEYYDYAQQHTNQGSYTSPTSLLLDSPSVQEVEEEEEEEEVKNESYESY